LLDLLLLKDYNGVWMLAAVPGPFLMHVSCRKTGREFPLAPARYLTSGMAFVPYQPDPVSVHLAAGFMTLQEDTDVSAAEEIQVLPQ